MVDGARQAGDSISALEDVVRVMIWEWEGSSNLPSKIAREIVRFLLTSDDLQKAVREVHGLGTER